MEKAWSLHEVSASEYNDKTRGKLKNCFNRSDFCELNRYKADEVKYLIFCKNNSERFAMAAGITDGVFCCPFSAPFGYPEDLKNTADVEDFMNAGYVLDEYVMEHCRGGMITFPPSLYDKRAIETWLNVFHNLKWTVSTVDLSFGMNLTDLMHNYESKLEHSARKNLRIGKESGLLFYRCETEKEKHRAYEVIKKNRGAKGYPLRMSEQDVMKTMKIIPSSMYLTIWEETDIAAALVYEVADDIADVIYWGDIPGYSAQKPINYLSYMLMELYAGRGFRYLDIGTSTVAGIPNYGLCHFKDAIGCERSIKITMKKEL